MKTLRNISCPLRKWPILDNNYDIIMKGFRNYKMQQSLYNKENKKFIF